ncbi:hypothetical protein [Paraburkholderia bannensis]|uniref:hypothetical protein n=1 Tax=Paraburkholderia bannensis TaxID=765414 RepID=UPI002ABE17E7|nr:hypothetical protein [Paraburkholderia bannensis]
MMIMAAVIVGMVVGMRAIVRVIVRMGVCGIIAVVVAACMPVVAMIVRMAMLLCVVVSMTTFGAMTCVIMPRFDFIARCRARACRRGVRLPGTRPETLRQRAPRQENMNHGRILPKVTESLDSL